MFPPRLEEQLPFVLQGTCPLLALELWLAPAVCRTQASDTTPGLPGFTLGIQPSARSCPPPGFLPFSQTPPAGQAQLLCALSVSYLGSSSIQQGRPSRPRLAPLLWEAFQVSLAEPLPLCFLFEPPLERYIHPEPVNVTLSGKRVLKDVIQVRFSK